MQFVNVKQVVVLGGGSAGFLAAITLKAKLPQLDVRLIRSSEIGIIGVGEGTTPMVPVHLHGYLKIDPAEFYAVAQPTWKLGIRFVWGPRSYFNYTFANQLDGKFDVLPKWSGFYCSDEFEYAGLSSALMTEGRIFEYMESGAPRIDGNVAYHFENEKLVQFLEMYAEKIGVVVTDGTVETVETCDQGVDALLLTTGERVAADLFVDCSGFKSLLLGKTLQEPFFDFKSSLFCDRAVLGGWKRQGEPILPYTTSETMDSGWCWQIEHEQHITRGYVYSSDFISDDDAERELREKNPRIGDTRVVKFTSGRYRNAWVKNVVAIGNSGGFVEPLESTSLGVICNDCRTLALALMDSDCRITPSLSAQFNKLRARSWDTIRGFLAVHYRFNARLDTPFWRACLADVELAGAQEIVDFYQENGPTCVFRGTLVDPFDQFRLDGYYTMLVGQAVPHRAGYEPSADELQQWNQIRASLRQRASKAYTVEQALAAIRSPAWQWHPDFYQG